MSKEISASNFLQMLTLNIFRKPIDGRTRRMGCYQLDAPLYVVNINSGKMKKVTKAFIAFESNPPSNSDIIGFVEVFKGRTNLARFTIRKEDGHKNSLTDITYGTFFANNYELFLRESDAAKRSIMFLEKKHGKLLDEIMKLTCIVKKAESIYD